MTSLAVGALAQRRPAWGERLSLRIFGSPSVSRANGGAEWRVAERFRKKSAWRARCAATPVFRVEEQGGGRLPRVWLSEPAYDNSTGEVVGREFVAAYPDGPDPAGKRALELASRCFGEAVSLDRAAERRRRADCFRAAEILFLHAARRGCADAFARLGLIYSDDLCEGRYWEPSDFRRVRSVEAADVLRAKAVAHYAEAAKRGHAESCMRLADLLAEEAFDAKAWKRIVRLYRRSYDLAAELCEAGDEQAGVAALRLAQCAERGRACEQSFSVARSWYRIASDHLEQALGKGSWHFKREALLARKGAARMDQEINGGY